MLINEKNKDKLNKDLHGEKYVVIDLETTGLWAYRGSEILTVSFYLPNAKRTYTLPMHAGDSLFPLPVGKPEWVDWEHIKNELIVVMHNAKFDLSFLDAAGIDLLGCRLYDSLHAQFLIDNLSPSKALKVLTADVEADGEEWLEYAPEDLDLALARETASKRANLINVDLHATLAYAETDCVLTWILYMRQIDQIDHLENWKWLVMREGLLCRVTLEMEKRGLGWDRDEHLRMKGEMETTLMGMRQGLDFDPMSSNALKNVFGTENYDKVTLLTTGSELAEPVIAFRELQHDYGTFVVKLSETVSKDGVLHPNYRQNGTVTGRYAASKPNILGLPKRMRSQFCPRDPEMEYVSFDLSQIELAVGAWYSECEPLLEVFRAGGDPHQATATLMGVSRDIGKRVNFSMVYGISAPSLAERMSISAKKANEYIHGFRKAYPELGATKMRCEASARRNGYVKLYNGHKRNVPEVRKAWSFLIQSATAELAKDILLYLFSYMQQVGGHVVLHVHDEFVIEVPKGRPDIVEQAQAIINGQGPDGLTYVSDKTLWKKEV